MKELGQDFLDATGKAALVGTVILKSFAYIGLTQVNDGITILISLVGLAYMIFKAFNEYQKYRDSKKSHSNYRKYRDDQQSKLDQESKPD